MDIIEVMSMLPILEKIATIDPMEQENKKMDERAIDERIRQIIAESEDREQLASSLRELRLSDEKIGNILANHYNSE